MATILHTFLALGAFILVYRLARYVTTPLFAKLGLYTYHSRMFFTVPLPGRRLEMHLGTAYDFFKQDNLQPKVFLAYIAEGLAGLCRALEEGSISKDFIVTGCIYFLDHSSLHRFGFKTRPLNLVERFMFSLNYLELCILLSISKGRFCRVKLRDVKIAYCPAGDLLANKPLFDRLNTMLLSKVIN